jgi:hypothetical protein
MRFRKEDAPPYASRLLKGEGCGAGQQSRGVVGVRFVVDVHCPDDSCIDVQDVDQDIMTRN